MAATLATEAQYEAWADGVGLSSTPAGLADALERATAELQAHCAREFVPSPVSGSATETRQVVGDGTNVLWIPDLLSLSSLAVGDVDPGAYRLAPEGQTPATHLVRTVGVWAVGTVVCVTGRFGYAEQTALPVAVVEACCMLAAVRLHATADWSGAVSGASKVTVINVTVDVASAGAGLSRKRQDALDLVRPYRRLF